MSTGSPSAEILFLPLSALILSERNARKTVESVDDLVASIQVEGILQNLVVEALPKKRFGVVAGGRRLAALHVLRDRKLIPKDHPVPCRVVASEDALAMSIAENAQRLNMTPIDEFHAFAALADQGLPVDDIAARYGVAPVFVRQRLKLASAAPELIDAYRQGALSLAALAAYSVLDDADAQRRLFAELPSHERNRPDAIRTAIRGDQMRATHPLVRFVGLPAYEAAGGAIRRDLFSADDGDATVLDVALLRELAQARVNARAADLRAAGWSWVDVRLETGYLDLSGFKQLQPESREPTASEADAIAACEQAIAALEASEVDDADDDQGDALNDAYDRLEALQSALSNYSPAQMATAGVVLQLRSSGELGEHVGLQVRGAVSRKVPNPVADETTSDMPARGLSESLVRSLTTERSVALRAALLANPDVALRATVHALVIDLTGDFYAYTDHLNVSVRNTVSLRADAPHAQESRAVQTIESALAALRSQVPERAEDLWAYLMSVDHATLLSILAVCVSAGVSVVQSRTADKRPGEALAAALGFDMAEWWSPSAANYLSRVPKQAVLEAVTSACGAEAAKPLASAKKGPLVEQAERLLSNSRWVPDVIR